MQLRNLLDKKLGQRLRAIIVMGTGVWVAVQHYWPTVSHQSWAADLTGALAVAALVVMPGVANFTQVGNVAEVDPNEQGH